MLFGFMSERETIDAVFIMRRMQEEYHAKGKKVVYVLCGPREGFDRVLRKVFELAMRKKGIQEVLVRLVMCLYEEAETRVRVDFELSVEFEVNVGMNQGSMLSPFLFAVVEDVVTEFDRESALSELGFKVNLG